MRQKKLVSIVTPCYNEQDNVLLHFNKVKAALAPFSNKYNFEFIYTDNCSSDKTFDILKGLAKKDRRLKAFKFSRNIGANKSIFFGLTQAKGEAAILIQADLQDPPEIIPKFIRSWEQGFDVAYGKIMKRNEFFLMNNMRKMYYKIISMLSDISIPQNAGEFRLVSKRVLEAIRQYDEDDVYLRGIIAHIGFRQKEIPYERLKRNGGRSSTNIFGLFAYGINGVLSTSVAPIRLTLIIGLLFSSIGFLLTTVIILGKLIFPDRSPQGFTLLGTIITLFAGVQMLSIGIIGEYVRKIYIQSLKRPKGFVDEKVNI